MRRLGGRAMLAVAALIGSSFILVSLVVGGRLLLLGFRAKRAPELAIGLGLFSMGGFSSPLLVVSQLAEGLGVGARAGCALVAAALMAAGMTSLLWFTWRVFRPKERWARWLLAGFAVAFAGCVIGQAVSPGYAAIALKQELPWLSYRLLTSAALAWCGVESLHYSRISARRQRIGLSDPAVTNRFLLWGGSTLTCTLLTVVTGVLDPSLSGSLVGVVAAAPVALAASVSLWFAFLPPAFYTRWLLARPA